MSGELILSDAERAESLADSLEAQFHPVNDPSDPAVVETVNQAIRANDCAQAVNRF
jgi:archaellum component FlaG (FlaF/FlaG flagellin family)